MKTSILIASIVMLAASSLASVSSHALTDRLDERPSVAVSIAGIDLDTEKGRSIVFRRLQRAAKTVCEDGSFATVRRLTRPTECVTSTMLHAIAQVKHPAFRAYAQTQMDARTPRVVAAIR